MAERKSLLPARGEEGAMPASSGTSVPCELTYVIQRHTAPCQLLMVALWIESCQVGQGTKAEVRLGNR